MCRCPLRALLVILRAAAIQRFGRDQFENKANAKIIDQCSNTTTQLYPTLISSCVARKSSSTKK